MVSVVIDTGERGSRVVVTVGGGGPGSGSQ